MGTTLVDQAMDAALADTLTADTPAEVVDSAEPAADEHRQEVTPQEHPAVTSDLGPLTAEQAEKLINKAIKAATTFADVMKQIVARKAWEPLGYDDPRHMMTDRFSGKLINPRTGKPFDDTYIRRMANTAWVLWSLAESTGLDPVELNVTTGVLAQIPRGVYGSEHEKLVDKVLEEVERRGATTVEEVQEVIDATLDASREAGKPVVPPAPEPEPAAAEGAHQDDGEGAAPSAQPRERYGQEDVEEEADWQDAVPQDQPPAAPRPAGNTPEGTAESTTSAADAFDKEFQPGAGAPEQSVTMEDALNSMRTTEKVTQDVSTLSGFPGQLAQAATAITVAAPAMTEAINSVITAGRAALSTASATSAEGLFDSLDETELDGLRKEVEAALEVVPAVKAVSALLAQVVVEGVDLPGVGDLADAAQAGADAEGAVDKLEEFLDEIDFAADGF